MLALAQAAAPHAARTGEALARSTDNLFRALVGLGVLIVVLLFVVAAVRAGIGSFPARRPRVGRASAWEEAGRRLITPPPTTRPPRSEDPPPP